MSKQTASLPKLWDDLALRPYLGEIARRHGIVETLALPSMRDLPPLRIESLFVSPALATEWVNPDSDPAKWPQGQSLFSALQESPQLVVLGDPGGGKTTLSNWLAWRLAAGLAAPLPELLAERVPVPCILRDMPSSLFDPKTSLPDLAEFLAERMLGNRADAALKASLRARIEAGLYLLILDGVDEIAVSQRKVVAGWMKMVRDQRACVLATSRLVGYDDYPVDRGPLLWEMLNSDSDVVARLAALATLRGVGKFKLAFQMKGEEAKREKNNNRRVGSGYSGALDSFDKTLLWANRLNLMPFDQRRVIAFVGNWYRQRCGTEQEALEKSADLLAALDKSEVTQRLARTPNLLSLMAIVFRERAHLPDGKALLYDEIANAYINTIDTQRCISAGDALAPYTWKERRAWLAFVGFQMQLRRKAEDERPNGKTVASDAASPAAMLASEDEVKVWLSQTMQQAGVAEPEATAGEFLYWVARRSGLLLPRGEGRYAFVHLSFQEFFCACYLYDRVTSPAYLRDKLPPNAPVTPKKIAAWGNESVWRETLVYLMELLSAERGGEWVDDLAETLFGGVVVDFRFRNNRAALALRALSDRHIRLSETWRDSFADACATYGGGQALEEAGYAAVFEGDVSQEMLHSERAGKWRSLTIRDQRFSDASSLSGLEKLKVLDLSGSSVENLAPLGGLTCLETLWLRNTPVADLTPLGGLESLRCLWLPNSNVVDLTPISKLKHLGFLDLSNTPLTDLSPLAGMESLTFLDIQGKPDIDLSPLKSMAARLYVNLGNKPEKLADILNRRVAHKRRR